MIYLIIAIFAIFIANILKVLRQSLFIDLYDDSNKKNLTQALSISNLINYIIPFKLGYIYRVCSTGKKMKYGISYSIATIIVEIILDFICVSIIYLIFLLCGIDSFKNILFYVISLGVLLIVGIALKIFKKQVKKAIYNIAHLFNKSVELKLLKSSWFTIISFENIVTKVNKLKLSIYSICMWSLNILSCYYLGKSLLKETSLIDMFNLYFSYGGMRTSLIKSLNMLGINMIIYIVLSNILLFAVSYLFTKTKTKKHEELLPHANLNDRLNFLELYFNNNDNSEYFKKYLEINNDVAIIEDYSAGSNATTMLCSKDGKLFYRKYSFGKDADKLKDQIDWIHAHEKKLTLTKISNEYYKKGVCFYDMPYVADAVTCFNYVHTTPFKEAWKTIKQALDDIDKNLHTVNKRKADKETIEKYCDTKVLKNIEKIENGEYIKPLMKYDNIYINGKKYPNLSHFKKYLNKEYLSKVFENDYYSDIHGDFTIENIICIKNGKSKKNFYIIDPNTGNLHDSPYLDYGKLLQSIHGGYEFLMNTKKVSYHDDKIEFLFTKSSTYYKLFDEVVKYLEKRFGEEGLKSIFYHEIIHWLRLMPYKIEKNGERSLLFYAGLIMVASDVEERFEK